MDIDPVSLILAKTPNLERLARALRAPLPPKGPGYERELRRVVARALGADRLRAAAEERREMDRKETASEIADMLGEHGNPGQAPRARVEAHAVNTLPAALDALERAEKRIGNLRKRLSDTTPHSPEARAYVEGLRVALDIMRGVL